jgi:hypothetical protein
MVSLSFESPQAVCCKWRWDGQRDILPDRSYQKNSENSNCRWVSVPSEIVNLARVQGGFHGGEFKPEEYGANSEYLNLLHNAEIGKEVPFLDGHSL